MPNQLLYTRHCVYFGFKTKLTKEGVCEANTKSSRLQTRPHSSSSHFGRTAQICQRTFVFSPKTVVNSSLTHEFWSAVPDLQVKSQTLMISKMFSRICVHCVRKCRASIGLAVATLAVTCIYTLLLITSWMVAAHSVGGKVDSRWQRNLGFI